MKSNQEMAMTERECCARVTVACTAFCLFYIVMLDITITIKQLYPEINNSFKKLCLLAAVDLLLLYYGTIGSIYMYDMSLPSH